MSIKGIIGIVADDLTGANDTALQFFLKGSNTEIIFETQGALQNHLQVETWAFTTETRNKDAKYAAEKVWQCARDMKETLSVENFYKKIDSTLRGNVAPETLAMLDAIEYDAAVIAPAFIQEGRMTIGGYQLSDGVPIERTDAARDVCAPIYNSYIPDILRSQLNESFKECVALIDFNTISKGAGPITAKLNELAAQGKKLIVADAVSAIDLEQIALAINKSQYNILPAGSAGLANALSSIWLLDEKKKDINKQIPNLPKLILSGSKTSLTASQIKKLILDDEIENTYVIELKLNDILNSDICATAERISQNLVKDNIVICHTSNLEDEISFDKSGERLIDEGITREDLADKITDYLASVLKKMDCSKPYILITTGGETSYKCLKAIDSKYLQLVDGILPSISLCMDSNARFIIAKSGNMGTSNAFVDIINYFKCKSNE